MSNTVTYEIIIKSDGSGNGGTPGGGAPPFSTNGAPQDTGALGSAYSTYKSIKNFAPVAVTTSIAKDAFQWHMAVVGRNSGSQSTQSRIDAGMGIAGQAIGIGGMLLGGIATGNPLLLLGAVAGAVHMGIGYAQEAEQAYYERKWENIGLSLNRERAGASLNRSRQ